MRGDSVEGWHDTVTVSCCTTARDGRGASPRTVRRRRRLHTPSRSFHDESEHGAGARRSTDRLGGAHGCHEAYAVTAAQATSGDGVELPSGDTAGRQSRGSLAGHTRGMHVTQRPALRRPLGGPRARVTMAPNNTLEPRHSAVLRGRLWRLGGLLGRVNWYVGVVFLYVRSHWSAWARAAARSGTLRNRFVDERVSSMYDERFVCISLEFRNSCGKLHMASFFACPPPQTSAGTPPLPVKQPNRSCTPITSSFSYPQLTIILY